MSFHYHGHWWLFTQHFTDAFCSVYVINELTELHGVCGIICSDPEIRQYLTVPAI